MFTKPTFVIDQINICHWLKQHLSLTALYVPNCKGLLFQHLSLTKTTFVIDQNNICHWPEQHLSLTAYKSPQMNLWCCAFVIDQNNIFHWPPYTFLIVKVSNFNICHWLDQDLSLRKLPHCQWHQCMHPCHWPQSMTRMHAFLSLTGGQWHGCTHSCHWLQSMTWMHASVSLTAVNDTAALCLIYTQPFASLSLKNWFCTIDRFMRECKKAWCRHLCHWPVRRVWYTLSNLHPCHWPNCIPVIDRSIRGCKKARSGICVIDR